MLGRSRKGAWIEIPPLQGLKLYGDCRSRKGAWIEIRFNRSHGYKTTVAPARERGLKLLLICPVLTL